MKPCTIERMAMKTTVILFLYSVMLYFATTQEIQSSWDKSHFAFKNCNRSAVPFHVSSLELFPDPLQLGELIILGVAFELDKTVGNHSINEVAFNLRLKTDRGYTELCDIIGEDKCHYNDLCEFLREFMKRNTCPKFMQEMYNNNCSCPFQKGIYDIGHVPVIIEALPFQLHGTFDVGINLYEQGKHLGCIHVQFCITTCKPLGALTPDADD